MLRCTMQGVTPPVAMEERDGCGWLSFFDGGGFSFILWGKAVFAGRGSFVDT